MADPTRTSQTPDSEKPRWKHSFSIYQHAISLLREAMEARSERDLSALEREGVIKRFEYAIDWAWETMADYLEYGGIVFTCKMPRASIRKAIETKLIKNGEAWMSALDARNEMSQTYRFERFEAVIADIQTEYLMVMEDLRHRLLEENLE